MVRRLSRVVQALRDVVILLVSIVIVSTSVGPGREIASILLATIAGTILALTAVNIVFNVVRVKRKGYYYACSYIEFAVGIFMLGLYPPYGVLLVALNVAVLLTLHEKKTPDSGAEPPPPLTRRYRALEGVAALAILAGLALPSISSPSFSLVGLYMSILDRGLSTNLPSVSLGPIAVLFALITLVFTPAALVTCVLGYFRRRFALLTGVICIISSSGWILALDFLSPGAQVSAGPGAFATLAGGIIALVGYCMVRRRKKPS